MLKYVGLSEDLPVEYFYSDDGVLLVNATLPKQRILEIIEEHLDLE